MQRDRTVPGSSEIEVNNMAELALAALATADLVIRYKYCVYGFNMS